MAVALLLAIATVIGTGVLWNAERGRVADQRADAADRAAADMTGQLNVTVDGLATIQTFFASSRQVTGREFQTFVGALLPDSPAASTLLVTRVPAALRDSFERLPGSAPIRERVGRRLVRAPARPDYYPVSYRYTRLDRELPLGLNLAVDPVRGQAMAEARDTGRPQATTPVTLSESGRPGMVIFLPIYRKGAPTTTVAERRNAIKALVGSALEVRQLGDNVQALRPAGTRIQIFDGGRQLYGPRGTLTDAVSRPVDAADRSWVLEVQTPVHSSGLLVLALLVAGLLLSALVAVLVQALSRRERTAQSARHDAEERFRRAFEDSDVAMVLANADDDSIVDANDAMCELTDRSRDALLGAPLTDLLESQDGADASGEQRLATDGDEALWVLVNASVVHDERGRATHRIVQMQDVSERKTAELQLEHLADHDPLTDLLNRRGFDAALERELAAAARYDHAGALLVLDLDHFKYTNDSLGHTVGDELIRRTGLVLADRLADSEVLARLGGDEFAVILPQADERAARGMAADLLRAVREEVTVTGARGQARTTASAGIALYPADGSISAEELIAESDIAMYDAKEAGRDCVVVFSVEGREARMAGRLEWVERIRQALAEDRFVLEAQRIEALNGDVRPREELLLRMRDDDGALVPPGNFLHLAERFDLIQEIDRWVIRRAIDMLASLEEAGRTTVLEVNLSAKSLGDAELAGTIASWLEEAGVNPGRLVFEMTETAAIVNVERAKEFASSVRALGCEFAIDDFGAGFASFYYLKHLDFDYLKIDGEFIEDLPANATNRLLVRALVEIAKGLGKATIAEFVTDQATLDLLRELEVDYAQGFHIGRPRTLPGLPAPA